MRTLSLLLLVSLAACSPGDSPQVDEPYVAVRTHWQTGERVIYRSVEVYDGETLVRGPEVPQAVWESDICGSPEPKAAVMALDRREDLALSNRNLRPRLRQLADVRSALETSMAERLESAVAESCRVVDFSALGVK